MSSPIDRFLSRRTLLAGSPVLAAAGLAQLKRAASSAQTTTVGDCSVEPALQYLYDFTSLNFTALPVWGTGTLEPDIDWVIAQSPELSFLMIPPGWTVYNGFANSFDRDGIPQWTETPLPWPFWSTTEFASPDGSAAYVFIRGALDSVQLLPEDGAALGRHLVMLPDFQPKNLCTAVQTDSLGEINRGFWVAGDRYDGELLLSRGTILVSSVAGMNLGPGSTFFIDAFVSPTETSADLMLDVFLKFLYQQMPKGGNGEPTPTPSPTPW